MNFERFKEVWNETFKDYIPPSDPIITDTCSPALLKFLDKVANAKTEEEILEITKDMKTKEDKNENTKRVS